MISAMLNGLSLTFSKRLKKTFPLKVVAASLWERKHSESETKATGRM